jgi:hypothetical protein
VKATRTGCRPPSVVETVVMPFELAEETD